MIYLAYFEHSYTCRNSLEKKIQSFLNEMDRVVAKEADFDTLKNHILDEIDRLNKSHPRCKPVRAKFYSHDDDLTTTLVGNGTRCIFKIIQGKEAVWL